MSNKSAKMTYQSSKGMPKSSSGSQKVTFFRADKHYIQNHEKLVSDNGNHIHIKPRHNNFGKLAYQLMAVLLAAHAIQNMHLYWQKHYNICFISLFWLLQMPSYLPPLFSCHFLIKSTPSFIPVSKSLHQDT